jgi:TonB family protein
VAIGVLAVTLLILTFAVAPGRRPRDTGVTTASSAAEPATVSEESAAMRRSPDSHSETETTLVRGSAVTVEEEKGIWCRVRDASGRNGYLPRGSVERDTDRALRTRRAAAIFKFSPLAGDVSDDTPLLLAPFSFAAVWGSAERGGSLDVYSVDHGYYAVKLPDGTLGFVASEDVDIIPANPAEPALAPGGGRIVKGISVAEQASPAAEPTGVSPTAPPPFPPPAADVPEGGIAAEAVSIAPAVLLEKVEPTYPPAALAAQVSGTVVLQVSIDREGNVTKVEPKRQAPLGMTEAAIAAVERWKYKPAIALGGPIPSMKLVRIEFKPPE